MCFKIYKYVYQSAIASGSVVSDSHIVARECNGGYVGVHGIYQF